MGSGKKSLREYFAFHATLITEDFGDPMKAYGYCRRDRLTCRYGCCAGLKAGLHRRSRARIDSQMRKRARRLGKVSCRRYLNEGG